jgi:hypothetical protein
MSQRYAEENNYMKTGALSDFRFLKSAEDHVGDSTSVIPSSRGPACERMFGIMRSVRDASL